VTLGGRRWGPRIGGWLNALPLVAGPTLFFLSIEQGTAFGARAALTTLAGLVGVAAFSLVYGWAAQRVRWWAALLAAWAAFGIVTLLLHDLPWRPWPAAVAAVIAFGIARLALPALRGSPARMTPPPWDLPLRVVAAVTMVLTVTGLANVVGPELSGALTPFPVASAILLGFTHAQQGAAATIAFLRGFLPAMWGFVVFCLALTLALVPLGIVMGFVVALIAQSAAHGVVLWALRFEAGRRPQPAA